MVHVTAVDISTPNVRINDDVSVYITLQPDYLDVGNYDIVIYNSLSGYPGTWSAKTSVTGWINPLGGPQTIPPIKVSFTAAGAYYVGAQDRGEPNQGNPGFYDVVTVMPPISPGNGYLSVTSNPSGAELFVDGSSKGLTPAGLELPAGQHHVKLTKDTYKTREEYITVVSGTTTTKNYTLAKEGSILDTLVEYAPWIIVGGVALIAVVIIAKSGAQKVVYRKVGRTARGTYEGAKDAYKYMKEGWEEV